MPRKPLLKKTIGSLGPVLDVQREDSEHDDGVVAGGVLCFQHTVEPGVRLLEHHGTGGQRLHADSQEAIALRRRQPLLPSVPG